MTTGNAIKYMVEVDSKGAVTGIKAATDAADQGGSKFKVLDTVLKGVQLGMGLDIWGSFKNVIQGAIAALPALIGKTGEYAGGLLKMNSGLKLSIEAQQVLMRAGDDVGVSWENQAKAIRTMQLELAKSPESVTRLGLSWKEIKDLAPEQQYEAIGAAIAGIEDPIQRTRAAADFFGKSGTEVLGLFEGAIATAREANEKFALSMSQGTAQAVDRLADNIDLGGKAVDNWSTSLVGAIASSEPLQMVVEGVLDVIGWLSREIKANQDTISQWVSIGVLSMLNALMMITPAIGVAIDGFTGLRILLAVMIKGWKDMADAAIFAANVIHSPISATKTLLASLKANQDEFTSASAAAMVQNTAWQANLKNGTLAVSNFTDGVERSLTASTKNTAAVKASAGAYNDTTKATNDAAKAAARADAEFQKFSDQVTGAPLLRALDQYAQAIAKGLVFTPSAIKAVAETVDKAIAEGLKVVDPGVLRMASEYRAAQTTKAIAEAFKGNTGRIEIPFGIQTELFKSTIDTMERESADLARTIDDVNLAFDRGQLSVDEYIALMRVLGHELDAYTVKMMKLDAWGDKWNDIASTVGAVGDILVDLGIRGGSALQSISEGLDVGTQAGQKYATATTVMGKASVVATTALYALKNGALAGAAAGAQLGFQMGGPLGAAIGAAGGALLGWIGKAARAREEARRLAAEIEKNRSAFILSAGGLDILSAKAASAGLTLDRLFNAKTVQEYEAAVKQLNDTFELQKQANEALNSAMDRYGITINDLGPKFRQQRLDEMAMDLLKDYELLIAAGVDQTLVLEKMGPAFNDYVNKVIAGGGTIPEAMRPMIEKMIEMGLLLDENGEKITDISKVKFAESMTDSVKTLIDAIKDLIAAMTGIPRVVTTEFRGSKTGEWPASGGAGDAELGRTMPGFASGGIIMPRPGGLVARVAEGGEAELVAPVRAFSRQLAGDLARAVGGSGGSGGANVYVLVDPRSGGARQITPAEARNIQNAIGGGMIKVAARTLSSRVA